ncbi:MAG: S26 family signal peptidase [Planctomycetota bacterium]|nr:MAG: S26 family signal peptidase [Planctomycetota bacterium]
MREDEPREAAAVAAAAGSPSAGEHSESLRETLISIIIAFALAFVFRSFVLEPFVIPTGSMAPTLLGAHVQAQSPFTGWTWPVNPRDYARGADLPLPVQGGQRGPITVTDPRTGPPARKRGLTIYPGEGSGVPLSFSALPLRAGDRIVVLKHIYALRPPRRWEIIVFKSPETPTENFIKRLVGLPGESLRIVDGDIFTRPLDSPPDAPWRIARKPYSLQRTLWRPLFSSEYTPIAQQGHKPDWTSPWTGTGWQRDGAEYTFQGPADAEAALAWNETAWPITDWVPYNELLLQRGQPLTRFPVGDVRVRFTVDPPGSTLEATVVISTRSHVFEAVLSDRQTSLRSRPVNDPEGWTTLAQGPPVRWRPGTPLNVEVWHADQRLSLWADGTRLLSAAYDWSADERQRFALGIAGEEPVQTEWIMNPASYTRTSVGLRFRGDVQGLSLHRVGLDRDLHYQAGWSRRRSGPLRAVTKETAVELGRDEFFVLGDNSPASRDARMWDHVSPWVEAQFDEKPGVVPRALILGKAFFVYWPAPHRGAWGIPIPDFGRMRFVF